MKRIFDLFIGSALFILMATFLLLIAIIVRLTSKGPALYWSDRVGKNSVTFKMPKFRSMQVNTPVIATHLMKRPVEFLSPIGAFLRHSSLDELPQLFSIIKGDMSFVGPRPALSSQYDLIALRTKYGIDKLTPGVTGWAQINGRDSLSINDKVDFDKEYMKKRSLLFDIYIIYKTFSRVIKSSNVSH